MFFFLSFFFFFNLIYCRRGKPEFSFLFFLSLLDENDVGRGKCIVVDRNFRIEMEAFFRVIFFFFVIFTLKAYYTCIVAYFSNVFLYKRISRSRIFRRYKKCGMD